MALVRNGWNIRLDLYWGPNKKPYIHWENEQNKKKKKKKIILLKTMCASNTQSP